MKLRDVEKASDKEISNAYLSQLETGKIEKPSPHVLHALAEVYRVLVPGGRYLLHTPSSLHGSTSLGLHLREYRLRELGRAASQAGFQPRWLCLSLARFGWVWTVPAWLWPVVTVWEAIWNGVGSAGLRQVGGRWFAAGIPDVDVDLVKPGS